jgi:hypothetical protein
MINAQITLLLLSLYYINNNAVSFDYIKQSDDIVELLNFNNAAAPPKILQPANSGITVDNVRQILTESYKIRHAANSIKEIKLGEGANSLDKNTLADILYGLEPYMNGGEKERYSKINSVVSNVGKARKGISKLNGISAELSEKQSLKEKASSFFEVLSPFIDSKQIAQAKNIAEVINMIGIKNDNNKNGPTAEEQTSVYDNKQKHQIIDIIESIESKKNI